MVLDVVGSNPIAHPQYCCRLDYPPLSRPGRSPPKSTTASPAGPIRRLSSSGTARGRSSRVPAATIVSSAAAASSATRATVAPYLAAAGRPRTSRRRALTAPENIAGGKPAELGVRASAHDCQRRSDFTSRRHPRQCRQAAAVSRTHRSGRAYRYAALVFPAPPLAGKNRSPRACHRPTREAGGAGSPCCPGRAPAKGSVMAPAAVHRRRWRGSGRGALRQRTVGQLMTGGSARGCAIHRPIPRLVIPAAAGG